MTIAVKRNDDSAGELDSIGRLASTGFSLVIGDRSVDLYTPIRDAFLQGKHDPRNSLFSKNDAIFSELFLLDRLGTAYERQHPTASDFRRMCTILWHTKHMDKRCQALFD